MKITKLSVVSRFGMLAGVIVLLLMGCGGSGGDGDAAGPDQTTASSETNADAVGPQPIAFATQVAPIIEDNCATCHNPGGPGSPHWEVQTALDVRNAAPVIQDHVTSGFMPPWPASDKSVPFHGDRSLSPDDVDVIAQWVDSGSPLDVAEEQSIVASNGVLGLEDIDDTLSGDAPYQGSIEVEDDYRCLVYPTNLTEPTHLLGWDFRPDQTEVVHHLIGSIAPASSLDEINELVAEDGKPGWSCGGLNNVGGSGTVMAWAPGQGPTVYPEGSGLPLQAGDLLILQIHYHYDESAPADASTLEVDYAEPADGEIDPVTVRQYVGPAEIPCSTSETGPLCDRDAAVAKNLATFGGAGAIGLGINRLCGVEPEDFADMTDGIATSTCDQKVSQSGEIVSVFVHEHEIGKSIRLTLNPDTPDERILIDVPKWDFDWQYNYYPVDSIVISPDDTLRIECAWDRSLRDPDLEPAYVLWSNGTNDEMCYSDVVTRPVNDEA